MRWKAGNNIRLAILGMGCLLHLGVMGQQYTRWVDPHIGSSGHGHVFVGASVPFGAVQVGPNQRYQGWDWCSGYHYSDSLINGFSHLHLSGTGIGDLGDIALMPLRQQKPEQLNINPAYSFDHRNETVKPGYYSVALNNGIEVSLTASARAGFHQYRFPEQSSTPVLIDLQTGIHDTSIATFITQVDAHHLQGYRVSTGWAKAQKVYFAIETEQSIQSLQLYEENLPTVGKSLLSRATKAIINFGSNTIVQLKVGISPNSAQAAQRNLEIELPDWNFSGQVRKAETNWDQSLSKIEVQSKDSADLRIFYTAMFHSMIHPSLYDDHPQSRVDNLSNEEGQMKGNIYSVFSTWDTYRAAHALLALLAPNRMDDMIGSLLDIHDEQGYLPIWHLNGNETACMPGISSVQLVAEAYLKGFRGFNGERAYQAIRNTLMSNQRGLLFLRSFQAIPTDAGVYRPVAQAMELSISDASAALMAKSLGKESDYQYFSQRAQNYRLFYDTTVGFFRSKPAHSTIQPAFDPLKSQKPWSLDYAEGNAWQYLWLVPQDVDGLTQLLGGKEKMLSRLDQFFSTPSPVSDEVLVDLTGCIGQYAHGNEPSHHIAYLYTMVGESGRTADLVRHILDSFYTDQPDGLIGNEDCGQLSAWYVFSALGFYPVFPASQQYVLGSPLFEQATIHLQSGKKLKIQAKGTSDTNRYIQRASFNGKRIQLPYFTHTQLMEGGVLELTMGSTPTANN